MSSSGEDQVGHVVEVVAMPMSRGQLWRFKCSCGFGVAGYYSEEWCRRHADEHVERWRRVARG